MVSSLFPRSESPCLTFLKNKLPVSNNLLNTEPQISSMLCLKLLRRLKANLPLSLPRNTVTNVNLYLIDSNYYSDYLTLAVFARCAQGQHERKTEYGVCGIITALVCLPSSCLQRETVSWFILSSRLSFHLVLSASCEFIQLSLSFLPEPSP